MSKNLNILLVGEESAGIQTLKAITRTSHHIVAVMASPAKKAAAMTLWDIAKKLGYPVWPAELVRDPNFASKIRSEKIDLLLNIYSLFIIKDKVLNAPSLGSFNMHPGPLPRYAGFNPVSWAIYHGENVHGVTIHKMVPEIDAGAIVYQSLFNIEETDSALTLTAKCVKEGVSLILRLLEAASHGLQAIPLDSQDLTNREYFSAKIPQGGCVNWSLSAREVFNFVRACDFFPFQSPWDHPRTMKGNQEIAVVKASLTGRQVDSLPGTVGRVVESGVYVACYDEWLLVRKLMVDGQYLEATAVLRPGDQLSDRL